MSGQRVQACTYAPSEDMQDVIATYWRGAWDLRGEAPHVTELMGDPCAHFVMEESDGEHAGARVVGVWTTLWTRTLAGQGWVRGVKMRAGAMRAWVGEPAHRYSNRFTSLALVLGDAAEPFERAAAEMSDDEEAFAAMEQILRERRRVDEQVGLAVALVDRIAAETSITTVDKLASVAGLGARAVQRLFRDYVGAPPKWVIRRNRLQEVALRIERGEAPSLAALAADLGYTDQAHLARDFKSVVGRSPSAFAASVATSRSGSTEPRE